MLKKFVLAISAFTLLSMPVLAENVIYMSGEAAQKRLEVAKQAIKANPKNAEELKVAGILMHQMNRKDANPEYVELAEKYLKDALKLNPSDFETMAWLGSVITMKAMFESDPGKQTLFVKMGSKKMDKAIKKAPDNKVVRLTRANNSIELPAFLKRTRFAVEDFEVFLKLCETQNCESYEIDEANTKLAQAKSIVASAD